MKKRAKPTAATQHTLNECRRKHWLAGKVEYRRTHHQGLPGRGKLVDLFGFGDVLAVRPGVPGMLIIQTTSASNVSTRVRKIKEEREYEARFVLKEGNQIEVWGWRKRKEGRRERWRARRVVISLGENGELIHEELEDEPTV